MTASDSTLSEKRFLSLAAKLRSTLLSADQASVDQKLTAYWRVGRLIADEKISQKAGYHNAILRDLSRETGVSLRTLQRALLFQELYSKPPKSNGLSWSHFRVLLQLPSSKERNFYALKAREFSWNSKQLEAAVTANLFSGGHVPQPTLTRPTDPSFLYKAQILALIDADTLELLIDLGFHTLSRQRVRLAQLDAPEISTKEGRAARNFVARQLASARSVVVKTLKTDIHGRFVVHLFFTSTELSIVECFNTGTHLNDLLLREKHARLIG